MKNGEIITIIGVIMIAISTFLFIYSMHTIDLKTNIYGFTFSVALFIESFPIGMFGMALTQKERMEELKNV